MRGAHAAGDFNLGEGGSLPASELLAGTFRFSELALRHLTIGNIQTDGESHGEVKLSVGQDAGIEGKAQIGVKGLTIRSPDLSAPAQSVGAYSLEARFSTSSEQVTISNAKVTHEGKPLVAAQAYIQRPYEANPELALGIAELKFAWKDLLPRIHSLRRVPQQLEVLTRHMKSGHVAIEKASFDSSLLALENLSLDSILSKLSLNATFTELSFASPPGTQLPDVTGASMQILFSQADSLDAAGQRQRRQIRTPRHRSENRSDQKAGLDEVPYHILDARAMLDLRGVLCSPAAVKLLDQFDVHERDRLGCRSSGVWSTFDLGCLGQRCEKIFPDPSGASTW